MIEKQLLKIRLYRHEKAQRLLSVAHRALAEAQQALKSAKAQLVKFSPYRKQKILSLYQDLMDKTITLKELENVRFKEIKLNETLAELKANIGTIEEKIKNKKEAITEAKQKLIYAQKQLNKAEEIVLLKQKQQAQKQIKQENDQLDEFRLIKKSLSTLCFVVFMLFHMEVRAETTFYRALDQNLPLLLEDIASRFNLELRTDSIPNRRVNGEYKMNSIKQFLEKITKEYRLDWFIDGKVLYIVPKSKRKTRSFSFANARQMDDFYHHLTQENKVTQSSNFPATRSLDEIKITFSAPEVFLRSIARQRENYLNGTSKQAMFYAKKNLRLTQQDNTGYGVMIFHLENAWAGDKEYKFADEVYKVPGIASVIRQLTKASGQVPPKKNESTPQKQESVQALTPLAATVRALAGAPAPAATPKNAAPNSADKGKGQQEAVILADERLNAVLVYDHREKYNYYQEIITHLDRASQLVEIEAMIVDIAKNHMNDLGVNWRISKGKDGVGFGKLGENLTTDAIGLSLGLGGLATALSSNLGGILAKINFLEQKGESRIVSRPSVTTMDNLEAVINTTQRFYVKISGYQDSSLYPVEAGTTLRVTPHIIRSKNPNAPLRIRLSIAIEDGAIDNSERSSVDDIPSIQENKVKTQAIIEQGESLLIGGHIHTTSSESIVRVPILGYIPLLSYFFSSESIVEKEFVRLFIIRPRVYE